MSSGESGHDAEPSDSNPGLSFDQIRADIDRTRAELALTVDQLAERLNAPVPAPDAAEAPNRTSPEELAPNDDSAATKDVAPEPVEPEMVTLDSAAHETVSHAGQNVAAAQLAPEISEPNRMKIVGGAVAAGVLLLILRRRRGIDD